MVSQRDEQGLTDSAASFDQMVSRHHYLPSVSVIVVLHNNLDDLEICLSSLASQRYPVAELIIVDSGSSDGGRRYVEEKFPDVLIIDTGCNVGFGKANNLGAAQACGEFLAFLNPDTAVDPDWLEPLVRTMQQAPEDVALVTAKILLRSCPDLINTCGNDVHYTAVPSCRGWHLPANTITEVHEVNSVSGAAFLVPKTIFDELGGFDGEFFMYVEDNDFSWRARLAGYRCLCAPQSIVYHEYDHRFDAAKFYFLERNRYRMLLKILRWRTLVLLVPALLLSECIVWGFALLHGFGHLSAKIRAHWSTLSHWRDIMEDRQAVQQKRKVTDAVLLGSSSSALPYDLAHTGPVAKLSRIFLDPIFQLFHAAYCRIISW